jgi:hypothetical protein
MSRDLELRQTSESLSWNELSRAHQKVLERLWAGGTLRGRDPEIVVGLRYMGYVYGDRLTPLGEQLCTNALIAIYGRLGKTAAAEAALRGGRGEGREGR